jgi:hypothetical protein
MNLKDFKQHIESFPDGTEFKFGISEPFSWRGVYAEVAFEMLEQPMLKEEILRVDADEIRAKLPEYKGYNASQTQAETKDIVNTLLSDRTIGIPCKYDIIYDGTMNSTKSYTPLIELLKCAKLPVIVISVNSIFPSPLYYYFLTDYSFILPSISVIVNTYFKYFFILLSF